LAQRLVRRLCRRCSSRHDNADYWAREIIKSAAGMEELGKPTIRQARGCNECGQTGFSGRTTIAELLLVDAELQRLVLARAADAELERAARAAGMRSMHEIGLAKVWAGETTIEEVFRATRVA
jgi:general secretion pathway protein E